MLEEIQVGQVCGCLRYHKVEEGDLDLPWEGWERGGCNWQQCECACHAPPPEDHSSDPGPGHMACCQGQCGPQTKCWGCKKPVPYRLARRIATYGVAGSTEYWHERCWGLALDDNPEWHDQTYDECRTCGGDGMLDDVMPCGDCVNGRVEY